MALKIQTTGLEQYAPGGAARLKMLVIGGPGAGKTRMASYWPKPLYADCEKGLASVADRNVPYVDISNSQDMLDLLEYLKIESRKPADQRIYETIIVDTLDAFQRKIKDEWLQKEGKQSFTGWEAWNYLAAKMQALMARLLNLDLNVIVNVHYKDKVIKDDDTGRETREIMLQLSGEMADTAFNDFDFVGWMGTYFEAEEGKRVKKRGLTFQDSPDKPFLKDRLHITPPWMEVTFAETDYTNLFTALTTKLATLQAGEEVGEVPTFTDFASTPGAGVVSPSAAGSGALPPMDPREKPLEQWDKSELQGEIKDLNAQAQAKGLTDLAARLVYKSNTLKSELLALVRAGRDGLAAVPETPESDAPVASEEVAPVVATETPTERVVAAEEPSTSVEEAPAPTVDTEVGTVDTTTGEVVAPTPEPTHEEAVATVEQVLGAEVVETVTSEPAQPETPTVPAPSAAPSETCEECGTDLSTQNPDFVKLAFIKYRAKLCDTHYLARRKS